MLLFCKKKKGRKKIDNILKNLKTFEFMISFDIKSTSVTSGSRHTEKVVI